MNNSMNGLEEAVQRLISGHFEINTGVSSQPFENARVISSKFNNVNYNLARGWDDVATTLQKIQTKVTELMTDLSSAIKQYADETMRAENELNAVVSSTVEASQKILVDLGI